MSYMYTRNKPLQYLRPYYNIINFIFRIQYVDNDVSNSNIIDYVTGAGIQVLKVVRLSSVNAPNRSFKLPEPLPIMKRYLTKSCGKRVPEFGNGVHMVGRINFICIDSRPTYLLI